MSRVLRRATSHWRELVDKTHLTLWQLLSCYVEKWVMQSIPESLNKVNIATFQRATQSCLQKLNSAFRYASPSEPHPGNYPYKHWPKAYIADAAKYFFPLIFIRSWGTSTLLQHLCVWPLVLLHFLRHWRSAKLKQILTNRSLQTGEGRLGTLENTTKLHATLDFRLLRIKATIACNQSKCGSVCISS